MLKLVSVDKMREYEWSRDWLWAVCFPDGPDGFNEWFPAPDVDEGQAALDTFQFTGGLSTFELPQSTTALSINITFVDDKALSVNKWVENWINEEILHRSSNYSGVSCLADAVKKLNVIRFTSKEEIVYDASYWVLPKGAFSMKGSSGSSQVISNQMEFVIAGRITQRSSYNTTISGRRTVLSTSSSAKTALSGVARATGLGSIVT